MSEQELLDSGFVALETSEGRKIVCTAWIQEVVCAVVLSDKTVLKLAAGSLAENLKVLSAAFNK